MNEIEALIAQWRALAKDEQFGFEARIVAGQCASQLETTWHDIDHGHEFVQDCPICDKELEEYS